MFDDTAVAVVVRSSVLTCQRMFQCGNRLLLLGDCRCLKKDARDDARLVLAENLSLEESTCFDLPWFEKADLKNGLFVVYICTLGTRG